MILLEDPADESFCRRASSAILVSGRGPPPATALSGRPQLPSTKSRSTITATLPSMPRARLQRLQSRH